MKIILSRKQGEVHIITKSINQYPQSFKNITDEIQLLNEYEYSTVVFDDIVLSKQESNIDLFSTTRRHKNNDIHQRSQNFFHLPKNTIGNSFEIITLFKRTLSFIILLFHEIAALDKNLAE